MIQPTPLSEQDRQLKYLIFDCHTNLSSLLFQRLRNDHVIQKNPHIIVGVAPNKNISSIPLGLQVIIEQNNIKDVRKAILQSDVVIVNSENILQLQQSVCLCLCQKLISQKTLVIISNFHTWYDSSKKAHKQKNFDDTKSQKSNLQEQENPKQIFQTSFQQRSCKSKFFWEKYFEDLAFIGHRQSPQLLKVYLVTTGLTYGHGQNQLFPIFKKAITKPNQDLCFIGKGSNLIPMVHVQDLVEYIVLIHENQPKQGVYFVVDQSKSTQKQLISVIAGKLGLGKCSSVAPQSSITHPWFQMLTLNVESKTTKIYDSITSQQIPFVLKYGSGFISNIQIILQQFNQIRGIRANKIMVSGPPFSGKSFLADTINSIYNLPLIRINQTIERFKAQNNQFGIALNAALEQAKSKAIQQQQKIFEQAKKKKKPKKGQPVQEFDPSKVKFRLSEQWILKILRRRLSQSDCLNKGFILDSIPRTNQTASLLFSQQNYKPQSFFFIQVKQQQILQKLKNQQTANPHANQDVQNRRYGYWKKTDSEFKMNQSAYKTEACKIQFLTNLQELKRQIKLYVQRNGPIGLVQQPIQYQKIQLQIQKVQQKNEQIVVAKQVKKSPLDSLKPDQIKYLDQKSKPIRQYLIDNVVPVVTEGLVEICKNIQKSADPLQEFINFLQRKSLQD